MKVLSLKSRVLFIILKAGHKEIFMPSHEVIKSKFILLDQTSTTKYRKLEDFSVYFKRIEFPHTIS